MALKTLITGISGFAGSHLAEYLSQHSDDEILGTYISERNVDFVKKIPRVFLSYLDLNDEQAVIEYIKKIRPDRIFHLAALAAPSESYKSPNETITTNIKIQINILEALRKLEAFNTRVLVTSSADIYGKVDPKHLPMDEDTPCRPLNPYAVSKLTQDFLGLQYFLAYKLSIIRVRPFNHIGPRQAPNFAIPSFAKKIADIEKKRISPVLRVGNLETKRDFTDVRDMVKAYVLAIEKGEVGDVYNIGSGISHLMSHVVEKLISLSEMHIEIEKDPKLFRPSDTPELICNPVKFERLTGWKPQFPLEISLKDTLAYFRNLD